MLDMTTSHIGTADIAREFGVTRQTIQHWRRDSGFPEPDVTIGGAPGWLPERMNDIREWHASRPGQGAGGGRPRKHPAKEGGQ